MRAIQEFVVPHIDLEACKAPSKEERTEYLTGKVNMGETNHDLTVWEGQAAREAATEFGGPMALPEPQMDELTKLFRVG